VDEKLFHDFIFNLFARNNDYIVVKLLDNYMLFKDKNELEILIRNDLCRLFLDRRLTLPSDIFAIPDEQQGFDPAVSDYRTVILFKLNQIMFNLDITIRVNRPEKIVSTESLITMSRLALKEYVPIKEDYHMFRMTFDQISEVRKELA
jgi:hypothetical protein